MWVFWQNMTWTIRKILLLIIFVLSIGLAGTLIWATGEYQRFTRDTLTSLSTEITEKLIHQQLERFHSRNVASFTDGWSLIPTLINGINENDLNKLVVAADRMFSTLEVKNEIFDLINVAIYDHEMNLVTMSARGTDDNLSDRPDNIERLRAFSDGRKRTGLKVLWKTIDGRPVHSTIEPIGGFRLLGYIEFVIDPMTALVGMADVAGGVFELTNVDGEVLIHSEPTGENEANDSDVAESNLQTLYIPLHGTIGEPWAVGAVTRDMSSLNMAAVDLQNRSVAVVIVVSVTSFLLAWVLLHFSVFRKIKRFAFILESLADGVTSFRIPSTGGDEFSNMRVALESLQSSVTLKQELQIKSEVELIQRKEMEAELRDSKEQAETASLTKSDFLAHMSHELRTPLNAITGYAQLMENCTFGKHGHPKYQEYSGDILGAGNHLLSVINDILDLSKVEAGELTFLPEWFELRPAIEDCIKLVVAKSEGNYGRIKTETLGQVDEIYADERIVRQILLNLLSNADKFTPMNGSITVSVRTDESDNILVTITDTGVGISAKDLAIVLEPFGQVRANAQLSHEGTGLGLPLSKSLMELHNGTLELESEPGVGTTVTLEFPAVSVIT